MRNGARSTSAVTRNQGVNYRERATVDLISNTIPRSILSYHSLTTSKSRREVRSFARLPAAMDQCALGGAKQKTTKPNVRAALGSNERRGRSSRRHSTGGKAQNRRAHPLIEHHAAPAHTVVADRESPFALDRRAATRAPAPAAGGRRHAEGGAGRVSPRRRGCAGR